MELQSLRDHEVYTESKEKVQEEDIIRSKWVFTLKNIKGLPVYKARLVCKGFTQMKGINFNTTYSPVSSYDSFRTLLAIHTQHPEHIMDASINALNFNEKETTKLPNVPTTVPFSNSSNSSVDTQEDTVMRRSYINS